MGKKIKVSEIYNQFHGKRIYKIVYKKELGHVVSELNKTGHRLMKILETYKIENDTNYYFNAAEYFGLLKK